MADRNRVTERPILPDEFWVVTAQWRGGHNKRPIRLENIHFTEKAARKDWGRLDPAKREETEFRRHPLRHFKLQEQDQ